MNLELAFLKTLAQGKKIYYGATGYPFDDAVAVEKLKERDPRGLIMWKVSTREVGAPVIIQPRKAPEVAQPEVQSPRQEDVGVARLPASMRAGRPGRKLTGLKGVDANGDLDTGVSTEATAKVPANAVVVGDEGGVSL